MGCFDHFEPDQDSNPVEDTYRGSIMMPSPKRFATGIEPQQPSPSLGGGLRRSASMPSMQKSRSDYNRAVGEALANSPKKGAINTADDIAIMEKLLSEL
jgi:hypothetical protein